MKNIPRIFIGQNVEPGDVVPISRDIAHYLGHVMRTKNCLVFCDGTELVATLADDGKYLHIGEKTEHIDPSNDITLYFAPIKKTDDLINMATQMGVGRIVPVITERTVAHHINWARMRKIAIESAEQSNRNSVPEISEPVPFSTLNLGDMCFADERNAHDSESHITIPDNIKSVLVGPEGGFSESEFKILDDSGAVPISLGKTILRAELAAAIAIEKITK